MRPVHTSGSGDRPLSKGGMPPLDPPDRADGSPQIRVLIADDHAMFRAGLRKLLEAEAGFEVVGEAENGLNAMALTRVVRERPTSVATAASAGPLWST